MGFFIKTLFETVPGRHGMAATVPRGKIQGPQQGEEKVWLLLNHRQERIFRIVDTNLYFLLISISSETNKILVMG